MKITPVYQQMEGNFQYNFIILWERPRRGRGKPFFYPADFSLDIIEIMSNGPERGEKVSGKHTGRKMTRREFLRVAGLALGAATIPGGSIEEAGKILGAAISDESNGGRGDIKAAAAEDKEKDLSKRRGRMANEGREGTAVKSALFFAGTPNPGAVKNYVEQPLNQERNQMKTREDVGAILSEMQTAGINTVSLSYWGHNGEDIYAPTLYSPEVFHWVYEEAEKLGMLVAPFIEVSDADDFTRKFPQDTTDLKERMKYLLQNFGKHKNWLALFDRDGEARRTFFLIKTVASDPQSDPAGFAQAFDDVSDAVKKETGEQTGFVISPVPLGYDQSADFTDPILTDLEQRHSILAAAPFNPESGKFKSESGLDLPDSERLKYADWVLGELVRHNIPVLFPVIPGYMPEKVFPTAPRYGLNDAWQAGLTVMSGKRNYDGTSAIWNGYTEKFGVGPTQEYRDEFLKCEAEINARIN